VMGDPPSDLADAAARLATRLTTRAMIHTAIVPCAYRRLWWLCSIVGATERAALNNAMLIGMTVSIAGLVEGMTKNCTEGLEPYDRSVSLLR